MVNRFFVRPSLGPEAHPLIELEGHLDDVFETAQLILQALREALGVEHSDHLGEEPVMFALGWNEVLFGYRYERGAFELHGELGMMHILAIENHVAIIADIARALDASDAFEEIPNPRG